MEYTVTDIVVRDPESIEREIAALEVDIEKNAGKQRTSANIIRLEIAELKRDVHTLAMGIAEIQDQLSQHSRMLQLMCELRAMERDVRQQGLQSQYPE